MRSAVQRLVEAPLAEKILAGELRPGDEVRVDAEGGILTLGAAVS
jgi:ATP-dependent Clp protease ATP-binding subunit ClpC